VIETSVPVTDDPFSAKKPVSFSTLLPESISNPQAPASVFPFAGAGGSGGAARDARKGTSASPAAVVRVYLPSSSSPFRAAAIRAS
jgi:hypothetical protein